MLENVTKVITRFFGIIAGSLSGISAILIAIGFLAERSHLKMLGFTTIPVDLNQYLYTGASLIGFLPGIVIPQSISLLMEPISLAIVSIIILTRFSIRFPKMKNFWNKVLTIGYTALAKFKTTFLIFFLFVQILTLSWMIRAISVENLLFSEIEPASEEFTFINANENSLMLLLTSQDEKDNIKLGKYYTQLLLITIAVGLVLRYFTFLGKEDQSTMPFHTRFWLVINFLLFATQIFLLPGNYGVLLLNNKYHEVRVQFNSMDEKLSAIEDKNIAIKHNGPTETKNKIRDQHLELSGTTFVYDLEASPKVFSNAEGSELNYVAKSDKPDIVLFQIDKNILLVQANQKGETTMTIEARNNEGAVEIISFKIIVEDEINKMGAQEANPIPPKTLVIGDEPFVKDLNSKPEVYRLLDSDPVQLSYQASSTAPEVATVDVENSVLTVKPISKGTSEIVITANDGYGHMTSSIFEVTVLGKTLEWPVDESLLLLYQSNDVFYLYSKQEKRIWHVRSEDIESMVFYGLVEVFKFN